MSRKAKAFNSLHDALQPRLHNLITDLWTREDAARDFSDPEGVHQMRVASRKLRAALDAADGRATKKEQRVRKQVRLLARTLGAVRDADVMIGDLQKLHADGADHPGVDRLIDRLDRQRATDRTCLLDLLDELDASGFREASLAVFDQEDDDAIRVRRRDARDLVRGPHERFTEMTSRIPPEEDIDTLHRLRIVTKRLRYVLQLVEPALKPASTQVLGPLGDMQDHLGDIHNDDVLIDLVRDELHALVDESIADAVAGSTTHSPETSAARDDLLALLATATRQRHERYDTFVRWWSDLQATDFPQQLHDVVAPNSTTADR